MAEKESSTESTPSAVAETEEKPSLKNFGRILGYGTRLDHVLMGIAAVCAAGAGVTLPLMNIVFGNVVSDFNGFFMPTTETTSEEFMRTVSKNALYFVYLFIAKLVLGYISMFSLRMTGIRISARLRLAYLEALFKQPIRAFDELPVGRPTTAITTYANSIQAGISDKIAILIQSTATIIGAYVVAFRYSWALTLVASAALVFMLVIYAVIVPAYTKLLRKTELADEEASSIAGEVLGTIRTIVACGAEGKITARHAHWIDESRKRGLRLAPILGFQLFPSGFAIYSNFALMFWFGIKLFAEGNLDDIGPVIVVIFSVLAAGSAFSFFAGPLIVISKAISSSTAFFQIIDAPSMKLDGLKEPEASAHDDIIFKDVNFSYPSRRAVKVLDNMNLVFPAGKVTALVGPSGCGKSTIVSLLERWYQISNQVEGDEPPPSVSSATENQEKLENEDDTTTSSEPNSGVIAVGSHNIEDLDLKWWRSQIGLVQQEPFCFNASIYTNVSYGLVGSKWERESEKRKRELVEEACKESFASEFIDLLPEGYDTVIGEGGIKLSGGQRQRLAIARSIVSQPPILILDEATSSIDVRGEKIVQEALDRVSRNRTTITIAHRLSTIRKADKIIVLRTGKTIEEGTHEGLLAKGGLYHDLVSNQQLVMDDDEVTVAAPDSSEPAPLGLSKTVSKAATIDSKEAEVDGGKAHKSQSSISSVGLFIWEQRKFSILYIAVLTSAAGCGAGFSVQSYLFAQMVQTFQYTGDKLLEERDFWALMYFILGLVAGVCYFVLGWTSTSIATHISRTYRQQYFANIVRKPIVFYDQPENSSGSLTARIVTDPNLLQELLGVTMAFPLISVFNIVGCLAISFAFGWKLTLVALFSALPVIIGAMFVRVRYEVKFEKLNAAVFAESSQFASEAIGAFRTVTSLTLENTITERYSNLLNDHVHAAFHKAKYASLIIALSDTLEFPCMALCFWYGGKLLSTHEYGVEQFFVIYIAVVLGGQAAGQFGSISPNVAQASEAANRMLSVRPNPLDDSDGSSTLDDAEGGARIEFKAVDFTYPTRDLKVFKNLSFTIEKGQFAALVGPSGCGKTSTIALLEKFYDYQAGHIYLNGTELRSLEAKQYRKHVSLVPQEPTLYQGSIKDNVLLGMDSDVADEEVIQACRDSEIHDFILSLPEGYDTNVGQRGLSLSGGQKQRICIARALIRNPQILLLDEATSSLDSESEKLVQRAFERTSKGRTVVVVAHRLATVQNADIIFVFGEGGIIESGNHQSLLRQRGAYFQMCESQALDR